MVTFRRLIVFIIVAVALLFFAVDSFPGLISKDDLAFVLPQANVFEEKEEPFHHYLGYSTDGWYFVGAVFLTTDVVPQESWGYRDQIFTLVGVDSDGKITAVKIIQEKETPRYTRGLLGSDSWFLKQFEGKDATDEFLLGGDVDAITGATVSSSAITRSIESGLEIVTERVLAQEVKKDNPVKHLFLHHLLWQIDFIFLWIILIIALIAYFKRSRPVRYLVLGLSIVYIGFMQGGGFSVNDLLRIASLRFPMFLNNLYWYSLVFIVIGITIIAGRFYCGWLCPFGAILEILYRLVPIKYKISKSADMFLKLIKYVIFLILLYLFFIFSNQDLAVFIASIIEPFATFFKLYGNIIAWIWLVLMLFLSALISRFYCKYLCPLGAFFALLTGLCSFLKIRKLDVNLPQDNCKGCRAAQNICQMEAIAYDEELKKPQVDSKECFMCYACKEACPSGI